MTLSHTSAWGRLVFCAAAAAWALTAAAPAEAADDGSASHLRRLVHHFDFEEADENNYEQLPRHWFAIGRRPDTSDPNFMHQPLHAELTRLSGYPRYGEIRFNRPQQDPGEHSLYLQPSGGHAGAYVAVGTLPAVPGSDYLLITRVKTENLHTARAQLTAYFVDSRGRRIEASVQRSGSADTAGHWDRLAVKLHGDHADAAWIGLQLELLQPERQPDAPLGPHQVVLQDIDARAWFDDVMIWHLPRLVVQTQTPVNIIRLPDRPELTMKVRDLAGERLQAEAVVYDHQRREVARSKFAVGGGEPATWRWQPPLPQLGWYLIDLRVRTADGTSDAPIARTLGALLWLGEGGDTARSDRHAFALDAEHVPAEQLPLLPTLLQSAQLDALVLSAFDEGVIDPPVDAAHTPRDDVIQQVLARGCELTLSLNPLPMQLSELLDVDRDSPLMLFTKPSESWMPYIAPVMLRYGQRVHRWRIGSPASADAFFIAQLPTVLDAALDQLERLAPQPQLVLPWRLDQSPRPDVPTASLAYAMQAPSAIMPQHLAAHLQSWRAASGLPITLHLQTAPADQMAHHDRVIDLAERLVYAWEAGVQRLALTRPWTRSTDREVALLPDPLLGVYSTVAQHLAGRRAVGRLPLAPDVEAIIFQNADATTGRVGSDTGLLVVPGIGERSLTASLYLGPAPVAIDLWGNRKPVPLRDSEHQLTLGATPMFVEGIDVRLAQFRAAFAIDQPFIESRQTPHDRVLTIHNPWPRTISGQLLITEPSDWQIAPRQRSFSIAAGQTVQVPIRVSFPVAELAGEKKLVARFDFTADERYRIDGAIDLELGLAGVEFDATLDVEPGADGRRDAVVTSLITNTSSETMSLYAFATVRGYPRQERIIAQLLPGQSIVRRFRFQAGGDRLEDVPVRVGLREANGPAMLNRLVQMQP